MKAIKIKIIKIKIKINKNSFTGRVLQMSVTYAFSNTFYFKTLLLRSNCNEALLLLQLSKDEYCLKYLSKTAKKNPDFSYNAIFQNCIRV